MANITPGLGYIYENVNLWQSTDSAESLNDLILSNSEVSGETVTRSLVPDGYITKIFDVVHPALETVQKEWIENFYAVNRDISFNFQWKADDLIYRVVFTKPPTFTILTTGWWEVKLQLQEIEVVDFVETITSPKVKLVLLDIPILNPAHSELGLYWAVTSLTPGTFTSSSLFRATTAGVSYSSIASTTTSSIIGVAKEVILPYYGSNTFDEINKVVVTIYNPNGDKTLVSATETAVLAGTNLLAVGAEIIGFKHALDIGNDTYVLTGLLRGRIGTEWAMTEHAIGENVVLLDNTINRFTDTCSNIDVPYKFKADSNGSLNDADIIDFTDTGVSAMPLSPVYSSGSVVNSTGDINFVWIRRARINAELTDSIEVPLDEPTEKYQVSIYSNNSYTTAVRSITVTATTTATYTRAQLILDFVTVPETLYYTVAQLTDNDPVCVPVGYPYYGSAILSDIIYLLDVPFVDNTAKDISIFSHTPTPENATMISQEFNVRPRSLESITQLQYVKYISDDFRHTAGEGFTLECFAKYIYNFDAGWKNIVEWKSGGNDRILLGYQAQKIKVLCYLQGGTTQFTSATSVDLNKNHLAVVLESGTGARTLSVYVAGTRVISATITLSSAINTTPPFDSHIHIGRQVFNDTVTDAWYTISEVKFCKQVKYSGASFTPPTPIPYIQPGDPYWNDVKLLIKVDGAQGGTTITDSSTLNNTISLTGGPTITTAWAACGTSSLQFDGINDLMSFNITELSSLGDFTWEMWYFGGGNTHIFMTDTDLSPPRNYVRLTGGRFEYIANDTATNVVSLSTNLNSQWYHLAVSRTGGIARAYQNGYLWDENTNSHIINIASSTYGKYFPNDNSYIVGKIEQLRITKGVGRYPTEFVPDTKGFPDFGA